MSGCIAALVASSTGIRAATVTSTPAPKTTRTTPTTTTTAAPKPSKTVTILVVAPSSGVNAESGIAAVRAVRLAVSHAVEDRLLPTDWGVTVETIDEAAKAGPSAAVGRKLAREADIVAVIGALAPTTAGPLQAATAKAATPLLVLSPAAAPRMKPAPSSAEVTTPAVPPPPLTIRMLTDDTTTGAYAADAVLGSLGAPAVLNGVDVATTVGAADPAANGGTSAPTVTANDGSENGRAFVGSFADRLTAAGAVVTPLGLASTTNGVLTPAFITKALEGGPRVVAFGGAIGTALPLSTAARRAPVRPTFVLGGQVGVSSCADALAVLGEGDLCAVGANPLSTSVRARAFREDYAAAGYGAPTVSVTAAYDAANLVIRALRPAIANLGTDPDPDDARTPVMAALRTIRLDGATGTTNFDAEGDRVTAPMSVLRKQAGRWVVVASTG